MITHRHYHDLCYKATPAGEQALSIELLLRHEDSLEALYLPRRLMNRLRLGQLPFTWAPTASGKEVVALGYYGRVPLALGSVPVYSNAFCSVRLCWEMPDDMYYLIFKDGSSAAVREPSPTS